eukprot:365225-Chlamydomonas_euryale.AAC.3
MRSLIPRQKQLLLLKPGSILPTALQSVDLAADTTRVSACKTFSNKAIQLASGRGTTGASFSSWGPDSQQQQD